MRESARVKLVKMIVESYSEPAIPCCNVPTFLGNSGYCIGGLLCIYDMIANQGYSVHSDFSFRHRFPSPDVLRSALIRLNPKLDIKLAMELARQIVRSNDRAEFKSARFYAHVALCYGHPDDSITWTDHGRNGTVSCHQEKCYG